MHTKITFNPGDIVKIVNTDRILKIIKLDEKATKKLNKDYYLCKTIGKNCIDSYPAYKLIKLGNNGW